MWFAKLKKKKLQYLLLGVIFTVALALISVSTVVTVISQTFAEKYYEGDSTPDIQVITSKKNVALKSKEWYEEKGSTVRNFKEYEMISVSTNLSLNGEINDTPYSMVFPIESKDDLSNKLEVINGDKSSKAPKMGEAWIASTTANLRNIKLGDEVKIEDVNGKEFTYKVSAIVNDSSQCSTAIGLLYVYINEGERENLKNLPSMYMTTMNADGKSDELSKELIEYVNEPTGGFIGDKTLYIKAATMTSSLIGGLGIMTSVVLIIVLLLILRANIKNSILKEYKSIGIYKSMGYSSKKIRGIYLKSYGAVSLLSSLVGIALGIPMVTYICNISFKNIGVYSFDLMSAVIVMIAFIIFNTIVYINIYTALRFVNKIRPVDAINMGLASSKEKLKKSLIKNNSSALAMAINDIFKHKKNNLVILLMFILVFYLSTLFLNVAYTMKTLDNSLYKIFGTANADLVVSSTTDIENSIKEVKDYLNNDSRVEDYYTWNVVGSFNVSLDSEKYKLEGGSLMATPYSKFNNEDFSILEGTNPRNKNEVSISDFIMKENNLRVGDYIDLNVEGKEKEFLIVGRYASMNGNGLSLRITNDALSKGKEGNVAFVKLKDKGDYEKIKEELESKFSSVKVDSVYSPLRETASQVVETSVPISVILLCGVLIFGVFNIVNILITNNLDNRKNYGIMKGLGFSSKYIKRRSNIRILILTVIGALIGVSTTLLTSKDLMKVALGFDVFSANYEITAMLVVLTLAVIIGTMKICNRSINKISTIELISE